MRSNPARSAAAESAARAIRDMSYPDFVGLVGQRNTPPGGHDTLEYWIDKAQIAASSRALDLACSTGFSGREISARTGCVVTGIDISFPAVRTATAEAAGRPLTYCVSDAAALPFRDAVFSHVLGGSNFGFIGERDRALAECRRVLTADGRICASSYYYVRVPPTSLLDRVEAAIGYRPDASRDYDYWRAFFGAAFTLRDEHRSRLPSLGRRRVSRHVRASIEESEQLKTATPEYREACYDRLRDVRVVLDEHRAYQEVAVWTWAPR